MIVTRKLWPNRTQTISWWAHFSLPRSSRGELTGIRSLILITFLILSSCTAHVFMYLDDLIVGLTSPHEVVLSPVIPAIGASEYFLSARFNIAVCYYLYLFNVSAHYCLQHIYAHSVPCRAYATNFSSFVHFLLLRYRHCLTLIRHGESTSHGDVIYI